MSLGDFSLVVVSRGYILVVVPGLLFAVASLAAEHRFEGMWAPVVVAHRLSCSAARGIFLSRDQTCVSCAGRQSLYH